MITRLDAGLEYLRKNGWTKGTYSNYKGEHCIMGAMRRVSAFRAADLATLATVIREQFPERLNPTAGVIPSFNDHPCTTFEDVEAVFEKAYVKRIEEVDE